MISVIICTRNRAHDLHIALNSLTKQTLPPNQYEIIVVDNGSIDHTRSLVVNAARHHKNIRYIFEGHIGLSFARNRGVEKASHEFLAFIDDDAEAAQNWLEVALNSFNKLPDKTGYLGGKVSPVWSGGRPDWLPNFMLDYYSITMLGEEIENITGKDGTVGANMILRKQAIECAGGFNVDLGRQDKCLISNEEGYLRNKAELAGYLSYYIPTLKVKHHIEKNRLRKEWLYDRVYWQGRSDIKQHKINTQTFQDYLKAIVVDLAIFLKITAYRLFKSKLKNYFFALKCQFKYLSGYWDQLRGPGR